MEASEGVVWCVPRLTPRLRYVLEVLFTEWLGLPWCAVEVQDRASLRVPTGWKLIAYGTSLPEADLTLPYSGFIEAEGTAFFLPEWDAGGFFPGEASYPWDLPAMAFYVLTLYYLYEWPYGYGEWGLYAWQRAPFYRAPFWEEPFLLKRVYELVERVGFRWPKPAFTWEVGWDIDHLYAYKGRGGWRWWLGGLRRGDLRQRIAVRFAGAPDPYDTFSAITAAFSPDRSLFFFLLSQRHSRDSLISPHHPDLRRTVRTLRDRDYRIGIHPSYTTPEHPERFFREKALLESYLGESVVRSRQHYLRFRWPSLLDHLEEAGIREDYTLAFPERSGFLLGTTLPVPAYRVDEERRVSLHLIGPALMDQVYLRRGDLAGLHAEVKRLLEVGKRYGGRIHLLWHNSTWDALPLYLFQ